MTLCDYDGRTALHLSAAEGHLDCVVFMLEQCGVPYSAKDRSVTLYIIYIQSIKNMIDLITSYLITDILFVQTTRQFKNK